MWCVFMDEGLAYRAADQLRDIGQAVTFIQAEGMHGAVRPTLAITTERKSVDRIRETLFAVDPDVVITVHAIQQSNSTNFAAAMK